MTPRCWPALVALGVAACASLAACASPDPNPDPGPAPAPPPGGSVAPLALWSQVVPQGQTTGVEARFVLSPSGLDCTKWSLSDGQGGKVAASLRGQGKAGSAFDVTVCAAALNPGWDRVTLSDPQGKAQGTVRGWGHVVSGLGATPPAPVVALGDTGCKDGAGTKSCAGWPLDQVLGMAQALKPALLLHAGDYRYRGEGSGSNKPDSWAYWRDDFLASITRQPDLGPWVFARGNHEVCGGWFGEGWYLFLGPSAVTTCPSSSTLDATWHVDLKVGTATHRVVVIDNSSGRSTQLPGRYTDALAQTDPQTYTRWLMHQPLLNLQGYNAPTPTEDDPRAAFAQALVQKSPTQTLCTGTPARCSPEALIVGHEHFFEHVALARNGGMAWPEQLVVGNGGVEMRSPGVGSSPCTSTLTVGGAGAVTLDALIHAQQQFGLARLDLAADTHSATGWTVTPLFLGAAGGTALPAADKAWAAGTPCSSQGQKLVWSVAVGAGQSLGI